MNARLCLAFGSISSTSVRDCDRAFNDKNSTTFAYAKIGLDKLLFAFHALLRYSISIHQLDAGLDVSYQLFRRRVEQFARTLDLPAINLVGPVEIDEVYVTVELGGRKRDSESWSRCLSKRGRGTYDMDKPPVLWLLIVASITDTRSQRNPLENRLYDFSSMTVNGSDNGLIAFVEYRAPRG